MFPNGQGAESNTVAMQTTEGRVMRLVFNNQCGCGERVWLGKFQSLRQSGYMRSHKLSCASVTAQGVAVHRLQVHTIQ